jgi:hypothetical protein
MTVVAGAEMIPAAEVAAAYAHLVKVVDRAVDARPDRLDELVRFVEQCRTLA